MPIFVANLYIKKCERAQKLCDNVYIRTDIIMIIVDF